MVDTLKKTKQFRTVYNTAQSIADSNLVIYRIENGTDQNRFGISASKKVGCAVVRNKIRRQIKEILRLNNAAFRNGYDIIFVVRVRCGKADYNAIRNSVYHLARKSNLLINSSARFV
ncbi:MAG: ribonuclease P protein component [Anaerofustis sp.]